MQVTARLLTRQEMLPTAPETIARAKLSHR